MESELKKKRKEKSTYKGIRGQLEIRESDQVISRAKILLFWNSKRAECLTMSNQSKKKSKTHYRKEENKTHKGTILKL